MNLEQTNTEMRTFTSEEKVKLVEMSVNEIELSIRAANLLNTLEITRVDQLIDNCTTNGEYTGLTGKVKNTKGVSTNYEIALRLQELGFVSDISHLKKPNWALLPPDTNRMREIAQNTEISLSLKLSEMEWTRKEFNYISYIKLNGRLFNDGSISDIIIEFVRISNNGDLIFLPKSNGKEVSEIIERRLIEWCILKPKREIKEVVKISLYEKLISHYTKSPFNKETETFNDFARTQNKLPVDYQTVKDRLIAFEALVDKVNSLMDIKEFIDSDPTIPSLDNIPKHILKILDRLQKEISIAKHYFTEEKISYYRAMLTNRNSERTYITCPGIYLREFKWYFRPNT